MENKLGKSFYIPGNTVFGDEYRTWNKKLSFRVWYSRHQVFIGGDVKFRLFSIPKKSFLGPFLASAWTRYKYQNYFSYLSKYWQLSKTNKFYRFLMPIIILTHTLKI